MAQQTRDLWPSDIGARMVLAPVSILREQAALLTEKTQGLIRGVVESGTLSQRIVAGPGMMSHSLVLEVPSLGNYRYELLAVQHTVAQFPVSIHYYPTDEGLEASTQDEFIKSLRYLLARTETRDIVGALLAQVQT